jgi:hypothetical protein
MGNVVTAHAECLVDAIIKHNYALQLSTLQQLNTSLANTGDSSSNHNPHQVAKFFVADDGVKIINELLRSVQWDIAAGQSLK